MMKDDELHAVWNRSSFCADHTCVEVAAHGGAVLVRDGKDVSRPHLRFDAREWADFVEAVTAGEFRGL